MLRAGANAFAYSAKASSGSAARAEVNVFAKGTPRPALAALSADQRRQLDWEAEMPAEWAPSKGADALPPVKVRPGEEAELEVTLRGPVADPVLKVKRFFGWHEWRLESVKAGEVKRFTGGPVVSGVKALKLESSDAASAAALVEIVKRYRE